MLLLSRALPLSILFCNSLVELRDVLGLHIEGAGHLLQGLKLLLLLVSVETRSKGLQAGLGRL